MRVFQLCRSLGAWCCICVFSTSAFGQSSLSGVDDVATGAGLSNPASASLGTAVLPGGGAMADFDTLMNLIQQTIDPDSWLAAGGVSTLLPYPSGVYIDPNGHMQRMREVGNIKLDSLEKSVPTPHHPWLVDSRLRTISLKLLDQELSAHASRGLRPTREMLNLAGLSRIQYVKIDVAAEDILLAGPADAQGLGFQLEDLALVASLINAETAPLGCSIEPSDAGILAAQRWMSGDDAVRRLARNPTMVVEQMQQRIGPHNVRVFGMSPQSGTAIALVDADEHMKKVGFGTAPARLRIDSYFDHLDQQSDLPSQSLIRWWFAFADEPIKSNPQADMFELPAQCVAVMSEQQWIGQQGRAPTGAHDPAADAFAQGITERLSELRTMHASYSRLCAVFESALALQLGLDATGQPSLQAWYPTLCGLGRSTSTGIEEPRTVNGLTTWHKLKNGTIVAVVSGGVKIDVRGKASVDDREASKFLTGSMIPVQSAVPSSAHGNWWWD